MPSIVPLPSSRSARVTSPLPQARWSPRPRGGSQRPTPAPRPPRPPRAPPPSTGQIEHSLKREIPALNRGPQRCADHALVRVAVAAAKALIKTFDTILLVGGPNRRIFPAGRWLIVRVWHRSASEKGIER